MATTELFSPSTGTNTVNIAATTSTGLVPLAGAGSTIRIAVVGEQDAFINFGGSTVTVSTTNGIPVFVGSPELFALKPGQTHAAAITASGTTSVSFTRGEGEE